ncbi:MAG: hypothetical protein ACOZAM_22105 [Pseudomonadota bacterium]
MSKAPLRPATPIDPELSESGPDDDTEIGKANKMAEKYKKPARAPDENKED